MPRPQKKRYVKHRPHVFEFGPKVEGCENTSYVSLNVDQLEALRLADLEGLSHEDAAQKMHVSRQTFGRIIEQARNIVTNALINCKTITIECDSSIEFAPRQVKCIDCGHEWLITDKVVKPVTCPECGAEDIIKMRRCGEFCECPIRMNEKNTDQQIVESL